MPLEAHEALTAREIRYEPLRSLILEAGADPEAAAAIVDKGVDDGGIREIRFFRVNAVPLNKLFKSSGNAKG